MEGHDQMVKHKEEDKQINGDVQPAKQTAQLSTSASSSSSPSHEFSFTISVQPSTKTKIPEKNKSPPFAIDLTPADEIFFHGHLLPLHLLSHLPVSPRSSTNSLDSFTLPIKDLFQEKNSTNDQEYIHIDHHHPAFRESNNTFPEENGGKTKSKSFSLFGISKWRKGFHHQDQKDPTQKKYLKFDISDVVKRYMRLVKPFLSFRNRRMNTQIHRQAYSFSGNLRVKNKKELRGKRGELSAPVSMWNSPTNSGPLTASGTLTPTTNDSTMEELQDAIQAAIAHCKNSIGTEKKIKMP